MSSDEEGPRGPVIPVNRGTARASIRSQSSRTVSRDKLTQLVHLRSPIKSSSVRVYQQSERSLGPLSDQLSGSGDSHNNIAVPARVPRKRRLDSSEADSQGPISKRGTCETRPWQRLKKGTDVGKWQYDIKNRDGHSSRSQNLSGEKVLALSIVHASSRNKKQHLRQHKPHITESDSEDDDKDSILSLESTTSYDSSSTLHSYQSFSPRVRGEAFVHADFVRIPEETTYAPEHSVDGFTDEYVSDIDWDPEVKFPDSESQKTRKLQAQIKTLTFQNEQKDAQIKALKRHLKAAKSEIPRGRTDNLQWRLLRKSDGKFIELGSGSYGRVYKGYCDSTEKYLAVKVVQDLNNKKAADVLEKEVKQLSSLEPHDRIVTYLGTCYAKHPCSNAMSLYVFTEFMPGGSLSSFLAKKGPLSEKIMWRFTRQILEGVDYLHKCGIIHRDIKGSNIMCSSFCKCGLHNSIKLADFGSAKQICSESLDKDKTKYLYGTAPWAAPELLRGEKAHPESDIWSVGATVVEMLTGETPYRNENFYNQVAIIYQVGSNTINPLTSMKKSGCLLSAPLERFLSSCFKSAAKDRPSAGSFLHPKYILQIP